jgi:3-isopropylmalate/(R)-2-methylmalate dehydratase small subunit
MTPFTTLTAVAAPLEIAKIDTGMIAPGRFQRIRRRPGHADYADVFLHDMRFDRNDEPHADFVLNQPAYRGAKILITGPDFGCGSSRESAAYALLDYGVRALVGPSFGDVFVGNCMQNGIVPVVLPIATVQSLWQQLKTSPGVTMTVDLAKQTVTAPDGSVHGFDIDGTR